MVWKKLRKKRTSIVMAVEKKTKGEQWKVGGIGIWWPQGARYGDELNKNGSKFLIAQKKEVEYKGGM